MQISIHTNEHTIAIQTNTFFTAVETITYDGKVVSRKASWLGAKHEFNVTEGGSDTHYEVEIGLNTRFSWSFISAKLFRNRELVFSVT
jgi:hypothetical protein